MTSPARARIVTFYSYKGGTGRSMALANVAWILAANGQRVLVLDWDLEAPGLHRYFRPFLADPELTASEGVIDFVDDYAAQAVLPAGGESAPAEDWYLLHADLSPYSLSLEWAFPGAGRVDFVPAGRQGRSYAERVNSFDWGNFFERLGGAALLREVRERLLHDGQYDFVLIDSRTGVSDTSGICTVEMPDDLVVCFTLNHQSVEGAAAVAESVREQRRDVRIFPVPMRIDLAEKEKLEARRRHARSRFALFPDHLDSDARAAYWRDVQVLYWPFYAYEELLAVFGDLPGSSDSLLAKLELLVSHLTDGRIRGYPGLPEAERRKMLDRYSGHETAPPTRDDLVLEAEAAFHRLSAADQEEAGRFLPRLVDVAPDGRPVGRREAVEVDALRVPPDVLRAFLQSRVLELVYAPGTGAEAVRLGGEELVGWPRLQRWVEEDREFLVWQGRLRRKREVGDEPLAASDPVVLAAPRWRQRVAAELPTGDLDFLTQSLEQVRRRRVRRRLAAGLAGVAVVVSLVLWMQSAGKARDIEWAAALVSRADELTAGGDAAEAAQVYRQAIVLAPDLLPARIGLTDALLASGDVVAARAASEAALESPAFEKSLPAQRAEALATRADVAWVEGNLGEAAQYLGRAVEIAPGRVDLRQELAATYAASDEPLQAIRIYSEVIKLDPSSVDARFARGALYQAVNRREDAADDFRAVLALSPGRKDSEAACLRLESLGEPCSEREAQQAPVPRIFVHYGFHTRRELAEEVVAFLKAEGFLVAGLEASRSPTKGDVRYFFPEDREAATAVAQAVSTALSKAGHRLVPEVLGRDARDFQQAQPGLLEVWLPPLRSPNESSEQQQLPAREASY